MNWSSLKYMNRMLVIDMSHAIGDRVRFLGWVDDCHDHGGILFLGAHDRSGVVQLMVIPDRAVAYETAKMCHNECAIEAIGTVKLRPGNIEKVVSIEDIEIDVESLTILSKNTLKRSLSL